MKGGWEGKQEFLILTVTRPECLALCDLGCKKAIVLARTPLRLLQRLCALIPASRAHRVAFAAAEAAQRPPATAPSAQFVSSLPTWVLLIHNGHLCRLLCPRAGRRLLLTPKRECGGRA